MARMIQKEGRGTAPAGVLWPAEIRANFERGAFGVNLERAKQTTDPEIGKFIVSGFAERGMKQAVEVIGSEAVSEEVRMHAIDVALKNDWRIVFSSFVHTMLEKDWSENLQNYLVDAVAREGYPGLLVHIGVVSGAIYAKNEALVKDCVDVALRKFDETSGDTVGRERWKEVIWVLGVFTELDGVRMYVIDVAASRGWREVVEKVRNTAKAQQILDHATQVLEMLPEAVSGSGDGE